MYEGGAKTAPWHRRPGGRRIVANQCALVSGAHLFDAVRIWLSYSRSASQSMRPMAGSEHGRRARRMPPARERRPRPPRPATAQAEPRVPAR